MNNSESLIQCKGLEKSYHNHRVLQKVDLVIQKGRVVLIAGPGGAGKSTLIDMISGMLSPTNGKVTINGFDVFVEYEKIKELMNCVWEKNSLYPTMSTIKNLQFFTVINGYKLSDLDKKIHNLLREFGIFYDKDKFVSNLSLGMQRKADICRALLFERKILILDEPSSLLDSNSKRKLIKWLSNNKKSGQTIIIATHHLSLFSEIADDIIVLNKGKMIYNGPIENLTLHDNNKNVFILKTTDRIKADEILKKLPKVKSTYLSQKAVHIVLEDADIFPILHSLDREGLIIKKVISKKQNLDKIVQGILNVH